MTDSMMAYSVGMLDAVAVFLSSEPIIYLFGLICLAVVVKAVKEALIKAGKSQANKRR